MFSDHVLKNEIFFSSRLRMHFETTSYNFALKISRVGKLISLKLPPFKMPASIGLRKNDRFLYLKQRKEGNRPRLLFFNLESQDTRHSTRVYVWTQWGTIVQWICKYNTTIHITICIVFIILLFIYREQNRKVSEGGEL